MATAVVSGRVDVQVRDRAGAYLKAAGFTAGDVIKAVWESIARTGRIPVTDEVAEVAAPDPWEEFVSFCDSLPPADPRLANLTDDEIKDLIASRHA